ncbi:YggT family protein [Limosilactobacillus antri]|uniref:YGGT family protein n=1 Tax=Limosilactobacillus antri DSM 16041 TaxID=525309 RepID=C8P7P0_9LACO|nr:YggT family protein [Limosilactobacillus antri]EEW53399.1 YGGT family protein [Limosilactobacillus antri DSM 16041]KRK60525.1 YlmG protein [Limosilactobacillus antri DSM 16041]
MLFVLGVVNTLINAYIWVIVIWCLLSWFPNARGTRLGEIINRLVEPYMRWFDFIPPLGGISFSPVVAIFVLYLVQNGITALGHLFGV